MSALKSSASARVELVALVKIRTHTHTRAHASSLLSGQANNAREFVRARTHKRDEFISHWRYVAHAVIRVMICGRGRDVCDRVANTQMHVMTLHSRSANWFGWRARNMFITSSFFVVCIVAVCLLWEGSSSRPPCEWDWCHPGGISVTCFDWHTLALYAASNLSSFSFELSVWFMDYVSAVCCVGGFVTLDIWISNGSNPTRKPTTDQQKTQLNFPEFKSTSLRLYSDVCALHVCVCACMIV